MGDPKFSRRSYDTPSHPWQGERIKAEVVLVNQFGLKNKTEVWKAQSVLRNFRKQARELQALLRTGDAQAKRESDALIAKCGRMGVLPLEGATLNDILVLKEEDILGRRLQTLVFEKGMASTVKQARQMIVHGHIFMNGHRVTVPGYIVLRKEESSIEYAPASPYTDDMHPRRISAEQAAANQAARAAAAKAEAAAPAEEVEDDEAPIPEEE